MHFFHMEWSADWFIVVEDEVDGVFAITTQFHSVDGEGNGENELWVEGLLIKSELETHFAKGSSVWINYAED